MAPPALPRLLGRAAAGTALVAMGAEAYLLGRRLGAEVARGDFVENEVRRVLRRETPVSLAVAAASLGVTAFAFLRRRHLLLLAAAGALAGSGALGVARDHVRAGWREARTSLGHARLGRA